MRKSFILILWAVILAGCVAEPRLPEEYYGEYGQESPSVPAEGEWLWVTIEEGSPEYISFSDSSKLGVITPDGNVEEVGIVSYNGNRGVYPLLAADSSAHVVYPCVSATYGDESFSLEIPSLQQLQDGKTCDTTAWRCVGTSYGDELTLTPVNGFVSVQIGLEGIDKITVEGEGLAGAMSVSFSEGTEISKGSADVVTLLPHGESFPLGTYAISVVPGVYEALKVSYWKGMERSTVNLRTESDFDRNRINDISDRVPARTWVKTIYGKEQFLAWTAGEHAEEELLNIDADLNLEGETIESFPFAGSIEGNGHKIYNFKVNGPSLFSTVNGSVSNLVFGSSDGETWDGTTVIEYSGDGSWGYVGLIGKLQGSLTDITSFVPVTVAAEATGKFRVGGMVSTVSGVNNNNAVMLRCHQYGPVSHLQSAEGTDYAMVGGLVGLVDTPNPGSNSLTMTECSCNAEVKATQKKVTALGGLLGYRFDLRDDKRNTEITIVNSVNRGKVIYENPFQNSRVHVGGIAGFIKHVTKLVCHIIGCTNEGEVSCCSPCYCVGGIIGMAMGADVVKCTNDGNVKAVDVNSSSNWNTVGGIVGYEEIPNGTGYVNTGSVKDCTNNGDVCAEFLTTRASNPFPTVGGIVGDIKAGKEFSGNVNTGTVTAKNLTDGAAVYAGGIVGGIHNTVSMSISGNVNKGTVSAIATGDAQNVGAGGIAGRLEAAYLTSCVNYGDISCSAEMWAGALVGNNMSAVTGECGGYVNSTPVTEDNFEDLADGISSAGTATVTFATESIL